MIRRWLSNLFWFPYWLWLTVSCEVWERRLYRLKLEQIRLERELAAKKHDSLQ